MVGSLSTVEEMMLGPEQDKKKNLQVLGTNGPLVHPLAMAVAE